MFPSLQGVVQYESSAIDLLIISIFMRINAGQEPTNWRMFQPNITELRPPNDLTETPRGQQNDI